MYILNIILSLQNDSFLSFLPIIFFLNFKLVDTEARLTIYITFNKKISILLVTLYKNKYLFNKKSCAKEEKRM